MKNPAEFCTLLDLQNSSYPTQPHSIIANYSGLHHVCFSFYTGNNCDKLYWIFQELTTVHLPKKRTSEILDEAITYLVEYWWRSWVTGKSHGFVSRSGLPFIFQAQIVVCITTMISLVFTSFPQFKYLIFHIFTHIHTFRNNHLKWNLQ